jgi:hypothetical protein
VAHWKEWAWLLLSSILYNRYRRKPCQINDEVSCRANEKKAVLVRMEGRGGI